MPTTSYSKLNLERKPANWGRKKIPQFHQEDLTDKSNQAEKRGFSFLGWCQNLIIEAALKKLAILQPDKEVGWVKKMQKLASQL